FFAVGSGPLLHVAYIDTMRIEPPFRRLVGILRLQSLVTFLQPFLPIDFVMEKPMIQRPARDPKPPKELTQHVTLPLVTWAITAGNDAFNRRHKRTLRRRRCCSINNHVETLEPKSYVNAGSEGIDDISDFHPILVEFGRVAGDVSVAPRAFGVRSDRYLT